MPPSPNPDTEEVDCYNSGQFINRDLAIEALEYFCDRFEGQVLDMKRPETERTLICKHGVHCILTGKGCFLHVFMSVTVKNGCRFTVGGKGAESECGRILRRIIDECDTSSMQFKQGDYLGRLLLPGQAVKSILSLTTVNTLTQSIYPFLAARATGCTFESEL